MDFKDYRNAAQNPEESEQKGRPVGKLTGRQYHHYIEEQIQEAISRGEFDHLAGTGKPLNLEDDHLAGDKTSAYRLLKQNGYAPPEIELLKEIRRENERVEQHMSRLRSQGRDL